MFLWLGWAWRNICPGLELLFCTRNYTKISKLSKLNISQNFLIYICLFIILNKDEFSNLHIKDVFTVGIFAVHLNYRSVRWRHIVILYTKWSITHWAIWSLRNRWWQVFKQTYPSMRILIATEQCKQEFFHMNLSDTSLYLLLLSFPVMLHMSKAKLVLLYIYTVVQSI